MGFRTASTGVQGDWALCSYSKYVSMCLRVALFLHSLLRAGPFSFPSPSDVGSNGRMCEIARGTASVDTV